MAKTGGREPVDELELRRGGKDQLLVLQAVPGTDLHDAHRAGHHAPKRTAGDRP